MINNLIIHNINRITLNEIYKGKCNFSVKCFDKNNIKWSNNK